METIIEYMTPAQVWARAEAPALEGSGNQSETEHATESWDLGAGYKGAVKLAQTGWAEGTDAIAPIVAQVDELVARNVDIRSLEYSVTGEMPDVGAMLAGIPEHMLEVQEAPAMRPVARVLLNLSASGSTEARTMRMRGILACSLVDALERCGIRVEMVVSVAVATRGHRSIETDGLIWRIVAKRAEEPLNMDRLAFLSAHPAAFRRLVFRLIENCEHEHIRRQSNSGYGYCAEDEGEPGDIVMKEISGEESHWTPAQCAEEIKRYLKAAGVVMDMGRE